MKYAVIMRPYQPVVI